MGWVMTVLQQNINRESLSAAVYFGFVALGFGALVNHFVFAEPLSVVDLICVLAISVLGLGFFLYGYGRKLSKPVRVNFWQATAIVTSFMVVDFYTVAHSNWYVYLVLTNIGFLLTCFLRGVTRQEWRDALTGRLGIQAGVAYVFCEFVLIASMVTILPVRIAILFFRLGIPVVMIVAGLRYGEGSWREQALFGGLGFLAALPILLF